MTEVLRIATRQSRLALWQAQWVARLLSDAHPDLVVELVPMTTEGDRRLDDSLAKIGGKGLFIKELEVAMLEGRADLAVHSMKDVPAQMPDGFHIAAVLPREDPRDALVSGKVSGIDALAQGAVVGTSSLRRQSQLKHKRPDLDIRPLRGNVDTRLAKLDAGDYDAIILAAAGLKRLGFDERIAEFIGTDVSLPAAAQGAVGIECLSDAAAVTKRIAVLNDDACARALAAERSFCLALGASCTSPVAALATLHDNEVSLTARVAAPDGTTLLEETTRGDDGGTVGEQTAKALIDRGALALLDIA
ncbi:MAG: hydroxymethylbilane synthase [Gammaproteobacteria bacterium]